MMRIINKTRRTVISDGASECKTMLSQGIGLMLRTKITPLIFVLSPPRKMTIHSFFMLKTIDILFLDEKRKVVDLKTLKPWKWYTPKEKANYIIEAPEGAIYATSTKIGDNINFL